MRRNLKIGLNRRRKSTDNNGPTERNLKIGLNRRRKSTDNNDQTGRNLKIGLAVDGSLRTTTAK